MKALLIAILIPFVSVANAEINTTEVLASGAWKHDKVIDTESGVVVHQISTKAKSPFAGYKAQSAFTLVLEDNCEKANTSFFVFLDGVINPSRVNSLLKVNVDGKPVSDHYGETVANTEPGHPSYLQMTSTNHAVVTGSTLYNSKLTGWGSIFKALEDGRKAELMLAEQQPNGWQLIDSVTVSLWGFANAKRSAVAGCQSR